MANSITISWFKAVSNSLGSASLRSNAFTFKLKRVRPGSHGRSRDVESMLE